MNLSIVVPAVCVVAGAAGYAFYRGAQSAPESDFDPNAVFVREIGVLEPASVPYQRANLVLSGTSFPVEVKHEVADGEVTVRLECNGEPMEEEKYAYCDNAVRLVSAGGIEFRPPLVLAEAPFHVGKAFEWTGEIVSGSQTDAARATITTAAETLNLPTGRYDDAIRISADVEFTAPDGRPVERVMNFWYVKGVGLVKRDINAFSTRTPLDQP
ncbi:MAG: hypothetical protein ACK4XJ_08725 [Fimbriimonadaceae bacterium]